MGQALPMDLVLLLNYELAKGPSLLWGPELIVLQVGFECLIALLTSGI